MVLEAADEILRDRADLHEVGGVPRPSERDGVLAEQPVDVGRDERLAVSAFLVLLDDPHDRREALGERLLVRVVGGAAAPGHGDETAEQDDARRRGSRHDSRRGADTARDGRAVLDRWPAARATGRGEGCA